MPIQLKNSKEIEKIANTGKEVKRILDLVAKSAKAGVNLLELDEITKNEIEKIGGISSYVDYDPETFGSGKFGHYICLSVNDAVLHGKPFSYKLKNQDVLCLDLAFSLNGYVADSAKTIVIGGKKSKEDIKMIDITQKALEIGISQCQIGKRIGDISASIGTFAKKNKIPVNLDFGGHGVGIEMHEDPHIPNDGQIGRGIKIIEGMVFAIEPWFFPTTNKLVVDKDGWTLRSNDGSRGYHFEHTVAITKNGPKVLT